jgi:hypothetical protein
MIKKIYFVPLIESVESACNRSNSAITNGSGINAKHAKFFK